MEKTKTTELLKILNEECASSEKDLDRFYNLRIKRTKTELSPKELKEFFSLIKAEENLRIKRIKILGKIAQLRNIPLAKLNKELGIKVAKRA